MPPYTVESTLGASPISVIASSTRGVRGLEHNRKYPIVVGRFPRRSHQLEPSAGIRIMRRNTVSQWAGVPLVVE